ncbi:MAG: 7-cyano-7-deazaguanine synthase QueC [Nitrospirae bacterium]|nr:7-cyano-7-deazaguanine synthase QueC [Nitrospirota bacterium]
MKRAVVLLSGGVDSTTTLAIAKSQGFEVYALSFDYEQRHKIELESARKVAEKLGVAKHLIINFNLREIGGSALTSETEVPKRVQSSEFRVQSGKKGPNSSIPVTYVPARNTIFLSFALAWAEVLEAEDIFIGANAIDYSGYPDCRPEFIKAFEDMANLATKASVEGKCRFKIHAPLINLTKGEIIKKGLELGVDYSMTWSCYDPQPAIAGVKSSKLKVESSKNSNSELRAPNSNLIPCLKCDSCLLRAKGFKEAGIKDPLSRGDS